MSSTAPATRRLRPPHRRRDPRGLQPRAVDLLEETMHLLRSAHPGAWAIYYAGAGAWVLGFLFFWARTTWFAPNAAQLAWFALGLTALFATLKLTQAVFCAHLLALRTGGATSPPLAPAQAWRIALAQLRWHAWGLVTLPVAAILALPFGWVWAFYQNLTALAFTADAGNPGATAPAARLERGGDPQRPGATLASMAAGQALLWPRQNHLALVIIFLLALWIWVVAGVSFFALPMLANRLLGIENMFGLRGWSAFNTTFLACITGLTWLAVDPLIKAFYTLRVFYGRSRRNGEDLLIDLASASRIRRRRRGVPRPASLLLLALLAFVSVPRPTLAETATTPPPAAGSASETASAVDPQALDRALDDALSQSAFQWRLRPSPRDETDAADSPLMAFLKQGAKSIGEFFKDLADAAGRFIRWLERLFGSDNASSRSLDASKGFGSLTWVRMVLYGLIAILGLLLAWTLLRLWSRRRQRSAQSLRAQAVVESATPDLRDENVQAAQLPADSWEAMAREQLALGEKRLALRALYLATLARLGAEGWLSLAPHKTNADYEAELRRRASRHERLLAWFGGRRHEFEAVWYGRADTSEAQILRWLSDLENGALPAPSHPPPAPRAQPAPAP